MGGLDRAELGCNYLGWVEFVWNELGWDVFVWAGFCRNRLS